MGVKEDYVFSQMESGDICVFPSEVSARGWLISYARKRGAVFAGQAISYDDFCRLFVQERGRTKASSMTRYLFLSEAIRTTSVSLPYFVPSPNEVSDRMIRYLASLLPQLVWFHDKALTQMPADLRSMAHDYETLYQAYKNFLESHDVYEPAYERPSVSDDHGAYRVLFPGCEPGLERLLEQLGNPSWIKLVPADELEPSRRPLLHCYQNHVIEVRSTLKSIHKLLAEGVPARSILISTARPEMMIPFLETEAVRYDVPLVTHMSQSPLSAPAGRIFQMILHCYQNQMAYGDVEALLLDPGIPYDPEKRKLSEQLMQFAVNQAIDQGNFQVPCDDLWERQLRPALIRKNHCDENLGEYYRTLKRMMAAMAGANNADEFLVAFHAYQTYFLIPGGWAGQPDEELASFCIDQVESLQKELDVVGVDSHDSFLTLLVDSLQQKPYTWQKPDAKGVGVYRWTDSAALDVPYHFFLAMDWDGTQRLDRPLACLPEIVPADTRQEKDMTDAYLSMTAGEGSIVSYHTTDYNGQCMAPAWFDKAEAVPAGYDCLGNRIPDPWLGESLLWKDGTSTGKATALQCEALEKAKIAGLLSPFKAPDEVRVTAVDIKKSKQVSSSSLDNYCKCPFLFASQKLLEERDREYDISMVDPRVIGDILHASYEQFYRELKTPFLTTEDAMEGYRRDLETCFEHALTFYLGGANPSILDWVRFFYKPLCLKQLEKEREQFPSAVTLATEESWGSGDSDRHPPVACEVGGSTFFLVGKIDRVLRTAGQQLAIVDYKKGDQYLHTGNLYRGFDKLSEDEKEQVREGLYSSTQLPIYAQLVGGAAVACYYSVQDEKYVIVWSPDAPETNGMEETGRKVLFQRLASLASDLQSGKWRFAEDSESCADCAWRSVCRRRYSTL